MKWKIASIVCVALLAGGGMASAGSNDAKAALKQVDKAIKGMRGLVAEIEYTEIVYERPVVKGSGKLYVHFDGFVRAEIAGESPRTVLFSPPYLYLHRVDDKVVEIHDVTQNPHRLGQYIAMGFIPAGSAMKKSFDVQLIEQAELDERSVTSFLLSPKKKDKKVDGVIARIQLWVDPETGLPLKHEIVHATGDVQLVVRYREVSRNDELPDSLFVATWPEGTQVLRK